MALSGSQVTRFGLYGGMDRPVGSFAGKTVQIIVGPPKFQGLLRSTGRVGKK